MGSRPGEHPRPAVVRSLGATYMEIHCTQICAFGAYCSLSVQSQRQRPCLESVSQCRYVSGLSRDAGSIGELRRRTGRSIQSSPASRRKRVFRPFHRVCPSGKMQSNLPEWSSKTLPFVKVARVVEWSSKTLPFVKAARVVCGEKTKIETDFLNGRATCLPYYY